MRAVGVKVTVCIEVVARTPQLTCDILAYMACNCAQVSLRSVSAHFGRHPNTVGRAVQDACDMTFGEALRAMKLQRAQGLLAAGVDLPQTARACGFSKPERLHRALDDGGRSPVPSWLAGLPRRRLDLVSTVRAVVPE